MLRAQPTGRVPLSHFRLVNDFVNRPGSDKTSRSCSSNRHREELATSVSSIYQDAQAAIKNWLCTAFGFAVRLKVEGEGGRIGAASSPTAKA